MGWTKDRLDVCADMNSSNWNISVVVRWWYKSTVKLHNMLWAPEQNKRGCTISSGPELKGEDWTNIGWDIGFRNDISWKTNQPTNKIIYRSSKQEFYIFSSQVSFSCWFPKRIYHMVSYMCTYTACFLHALCSDFFFQSSWTKIKPGAAPACYVY